MKLPRMYRKYRYMLGFLLVMAVVIFGGISVLLRNDEAVGNSHQQTLLKEEELVLQVEEKPAKIEKHKDYDSKLLKQVANANDDDEDDIVQNNSIFRDKMISNKKNNASRIINQAGGYAIPAELDYETLKEVLPHMWKQAVDNSELLPISCAAITFEHNPNMNMGDDMFIYASLYGVARRTNRIPFIDYRIGFPLVQIFNLELIPTSGMSTDGSFQMLPESRGCCTYDDSFTKVACSRKMILNGYRQNYAYFREYADEILATEFVQRQEIREACAKEFDIISSKYNISSSTKLGGCTLIGVHLRTSEEITGHQRDQGHLGANSTYLKKAFDYFLRKYSNSNSAGACVGFLVAGNEDAVQAKQLIPNLTSDQYPGVRVVILEDVVESMQLCLLSACHHTIITTGSTGWWIGYMTQRRNRGKVIYQSHFAVAGSKLEKALDRGSYFLEDWIAM